MRNFIKASMDISNGVVQLLKAGKSKEQVISKLVSDSFGTADACTELVDSVLESFPAYGFIQKVMRSELVADQETDTLLIVDPISRKVEPVLKERLSDVFGRNFDFRTKMSICRFVYNPYKMGQIYEDEWGDKYFNEYIPPFWQAEHFYSKGIVPIEPVTELPEIYNEYLDHFTNGDQVSKEYVLDWAANTVQFRNFCMLATIGNEGVGKGLFGDIMREILEESNFGVVAPDFFDKNFNSELKNKRMVYFDEISIKNRSQEEKLKAVINNNIAIEQKHRDAKNIQNFASFYISSNSLDAIRITGSDRRYSVINISEEKITNKWTKKKISTLTQKENISALARYLYFRKFDKDAMMKVLKTSHTETVRSASLHAWHDYVLDEYAPDHAGKEVAIRDLSAAVEEIFGSRTRPGRTALQELAVRYPEKLKVYKTSKDNKQIWVVKFPEQEKK